MSRCLLDWPQVSGVFAEAMELPASQRTTFLLDRCGEDVELLHEVHRLVRCDQQAGDFLSDAASSTDDPEPVWETLEPGCVIAGRYRIDRQIGRGSMSGGVYEAFDLELEIRVAVKVVADAAEFLAARRVTHPNVCRVFDCVQSRYLILELLEGETLADRGVLAGEEMDALVRQLCAGLQAVHDAGLLHRDLKPANVFLSGSSCLSGRVVLIDFGLASGDDEEFPAREFAGTLPYMAPELFAGGPATEASDWFGLGAVLFEACTGKRPFEGGEIPVRWRGLIEGLLEVDPGRRPHPSFMS
jgi:serine/threonine protein kinase